MARQQARQQNLNTFVGGLNTEANILSAPENTILEGDNVEVLRNGSARRRRSLDIEQEGNYSRDSFGEDLLAQNAISVHKWSSVDGDDTLNFIVIQIGGVLYFHKAGSPVLSESIMGSISLNPIRTHSDYTKEPIDADSGRGKLFIVNKYISPCYIEYDQETQKFRGVKITLLVRDLDGIEENEEAPEIFEGSDVTPPLPAPFYPGPRLGYADIIDQLGSEYDFSPFNPIIPPGAF